LVVLALISAASGRLRRCLDPRRRLQLSILLNSRSDTLKKSSNICADVTSGLAKQPCPVKCIDGMSRMACRISPLPAAAYLPTDAVID
jgi:hypothetical protein